jgi:heme/copper-type cytochrome/quinol oxidase subunit 2
MRTESSRLEKNRYMTKNHGMPLKSKKWDRLYLLILIVIIIGLPLGIRSYDRLLEPQKLTSATQEFILTGHAEKGWVLGEIRANDIFSLWRDSGPAVKPVIEVSKGDQVLLKLRSADVTHGFNLKAYGIYIARGIQPGKTIFLSFDADKAGTFIFTCNVFCGDIHQHMTGKLIVRDATPRPNA